MLPKGESDPNVLVGFDDADDAAAYRLADGHVIVQSVDFFTPVVDDPYQFGQIAAANALSDIYAMGATPLFALNIVSFPRDELPLEQLSRILEGGQAKAREAGIPILGGHTIDDKEPKYGLVVTGTVAEDRLIRNSGARPGDVLILTKPLGTGLIATALKHGTAPDDAVEAATTSMVTLNRAAAEAAAEVGVHAMTDITGFGLLGHLLEMCQASWIQARIVYESLPLLPGAEELARQGAIAGGTRRNLAHVKKSLLIEGAVSETQQFIAADAQTSGGLLMAVDPAKADTLIATLKEQGTLAAALIGWFTQTGAPRITLREGQ